MSNIIVNDVADKNITIVNGDTIDVNISGLNNIEIELTTGAKGETGGTGETGSKGDIGDTGATGAKGSKGDTGDTGAKGDTGEGVIVGGTTDQLLAKASATDYATKWINKSDVNYLSETQSNDLTDSEASTLHYHASDRARSNHTGTQEASTISDFDIEVSNNTNVIQNTQHKNTTSGNPHSVTKSEIGLSNVTNDKQVPYSEKGAVSGVAELDTGGRLPSAQLTPKAMQMLDYWDADANVPQLQNGIGTQGDVYIVGVAGSHDFGSGTIDFVVSDMLYYIGEVWQKSANSNVVTSVNGKIGNVVLDTDDITEGATNKYYSSSLFDTDFAGKTTTDLIEGLNLYYTEARVSANSDVTANTVHRTSDGKNHSDVVLNNTHRVSAVSDDHTQYELTNARMSTKGDLAVHNGTNVNRLPVGTNGHALVADSAQAAGLKWAAIAASSFNHNDLSTIDGGTAGEYYHFTSAQHTEINNFFDNTDMTGAQAETLTDGSNADLLHVHNYLASGDSITELDANNWKVFYSNGTGDVTGLALGANGTYFKSNGTTSIPSFETVSVSGLNNNQILFGKADGTIEQSSDLLFDDNRLINKKGLTFPQVVFTTSTYTITNAMAMVIGNISANSTCTAPAAATADNNIITIKNISSAYTLQLLAGGTDTIDGSTVGPLLIQNETIVMHSDGVSDWRIIARYGGSLYLHMNLSAHQTSNLTAGNHVEFDNSTGNLSMATGAGQADGIVALLANKTYFLEGALFAQNSASTGYLDYGWYDRTNSAFIPRNGVIYPNNSTIQNASSGIASAIITPTTNIDVDLRISSVSGVTNIYANYSTAKIWSVN